MVSRASTAGQGIPPGLQTGRQSVAENTSVGQICSPKRRLLTHGPASLLLAALRRRIKQVVGAEVRAPGPTAAQFWVLERIFDHEGMSLRDYHVRTL